MAELEKLDGVEIEKVEAEGDEIAGGGILILGFGFFVANFARSVVVWRTVACWYPIAQNGRSGPFG